jgi:uncharacterized protein (TIGR02001 family)
MYSKSANQPAIQGNLDYQHDSGFYTGINFSSFNIGKSENLLLIQNPDGSIEELKFPDQARIEITPYVGWTFKLNDDFRLDTQYTRYLFDGRIYNFSGDYNEFYLFLHYKDLLSFTFSLADNFYGMQKTAFFFEGTGRYPITDYLEASTSFGYAKTKNILTSDYLYWNAGLTGRYKFLSADLRYYDAREVNVFDEIATPDHPHTLDASVVFTLSVGF